MSVSLLLLIIIGFIIYKIIFKVCKCKIEEKKLLISVLTGEAFSFLIGYFIMGIIPMLLVTIICNVAEAFMVFLMNSKDIKGKLLKPVIVRGVLIIVNVLATIIIK